MIRWIAPNDRRTGVRASGVAYAHDQGVLSVEVDPGGALYFSDFSAIYRLVRS